VIETAKHIADLRDIPLEELAETLYQNSLNIFGLDV
jgi:Tat protein secretion system quality control protein TatD with DNase activity